MATGTKRPAKKAAPKPPPAEVEELEEDDELEELEDDTEEAVAPKKASKSAAQQVTFGVSDLAKYLVKKTGVKVDARGLRTLIRKMARDESGRVEREIIAGNRARYDWPLGVKDPEVKAIIAAFEGGELEEDKKEKLQALKDKKAAQGPKPAKKTAKKAKAPVVEVDDDEDDELEEADEDDE